MHFSDDCVEFLDNFVRLIGFLVVAKFVLHRIVFELIRAGKVHVLSKFANVRFKTRYGKWAVVTGCTDGIGLAYARELARRGMNVVLISRSRDKLEAAARHIERDFQVETRVVQADFSKEGRQLYPNIAQQLQHLDVGILVNNVGVVVPYPMFTHEMSEQLIWDHVMVNVAAATLMTSIVLPNMKAMKRGAIVNVSSTASVAPIPGLGIYSATKVYVDYLSRILQLECKDSGVTVQSLMPGYVNTKMVGYSETLMSGGLMVPSAETYARHAVATIGYTSCTTGYFAHGVQLWLIRLIPVCLFTWVSSNLNRKYRKEYKMSQSAKKSD